jgi:2-dehydro-3-deoxygluconokinase
MNLELTAIGEVMAELRQDFERRWDVGFAGDTFNTAVYCARAMPPGAVSFVSRIGEDPLSQGFREFAAAEGVLTKHVAIDPDRNIGIYSVKTDDEGERSFNYWRETSAARHLFDGGVVDFPPAKVLYFSAITLAVLSPEGRARLLVALADMQSLHGCLIAFDSNFRPRLWEGIEAARENVSLAWAMADIALPSIDDELALFDEHDEVSILARFSQKRWVAGALKRGNRGPIPLASPNMKLPVFEAARNVVDTTAAGDSFNGAYLAAFLQSKNELTRLKAGHECATNVVGRSGAIISDC